MDEKKKSLLSDNIRIWMHNEAEAQKSTEDTEQDIQKGQKRRSGIFFVIFAIGVSLLFTSLYKYFKYGEGVERDARAPGRMKPPAATKAIIIPSLLFILTVFMISPSSAGATPVNITIKSDADFLTCGCVSGGIGTQSYPYLISGLTLVSQSGPGLLVDNSKGMIKKYFDVTGDTVTGGNGPPTQFPGVEFVNLNGLGEITGSQNAFIGNRYGILLENSFNILIDGVSSETGATINNNGVAGIAIYGGGSNIISNVQVNHNGIGIPENFSQGGVGINLTSTTGNTIKNVVLSEDSFSGLVLFSSSSNIISGISVHYPDFYGVVIDGGSGNTVQNSAVQTADYVGLWLRDSTTQNGILSNFFSGNGPTGKESTDGIVPYFATALYLSSGASGNSVEKNVFGLNGGGSLIQDNGIIVNAVQKPIQSNNPFNDPLTGNEPKSPLFPSGPAGSNTFCGNAIVSSQGVPSNPPC